MGRKLFLIWFVLLVIIIAIIWRNPFHEQGRQKLRFEDFPIGDIYGSIETKDLRFVLDGMYQDSLIYSSYLNPTLVENIIETLKENGFDMQTIYLSLDLVYQKYHLLIPLKNFKKAALFMDETVGFFDEEVVKISEKPLMYTYSDYTISLSEKWLRITYEKPFDHSSSGALNPAPKLQLDESVFDQKNQFFFSGERLQELGVNSAFIQLFPKEFAMEVVIHSVFQLLTNELNSAQVGLNAAQNQVYFMLSTSFKDKIKSLPFIQKNRFTDLGLNTSNLFDFWSGELLLETGPDFEVIDTIVTTSFDEDFNPIEERRVRKKTHQSYLCFVGTNNADDLLNELKRNNFIRLSYNVARLPDGNLLRYDKTPDGVLFYSFQLPDSLLTEKKLAPTFRWSLDSFDMSGNLSKLTANTLSLSFDFDIKPSESSSRLSR